MSRINVQVSGPKQADFTYKTVVLKGNASFKDQIETAEGPTKFVIRWDFDLNDEVVTVPENCILEFDGGSLKNGTIIGQDTVFINVGDVDIWGENLTREGTWREHSGGGGDIQDAFGKVVVGEDTIEAEGNDTLEIEAGEHIIIEADSENKKIIISTEEQVQGDWIQTDPLKPSYIKNKPNLAAVATSGSYKDLLNKPHIPEGQIQSDWNQDLDTNPDYIKNKPIKVSEFTNDAGYLTEHQDISGKADKSNTYTKTEVDERVSTPHQNYVTVATKAELDAIENPSTDTIYRVSSYDFTANSGAGAVDVTKYSEYAYTGSAMIPLTVKSQVNEVFNISEYHSGATYEDLEEALGTNGDNIPQSLRKGGMSIKFIQTSDNKYVQYRLMLSDFTDAQFVNIKNWQGEDNEPIDGSDNLITSKGVANLIKNIECSNEFIFALTDALGHIIATLDKNYRINLDISNLHIETVEGYEYEFAIVDKFNHVLLYRKTGENFVLVQAKEPDAYERNIDNLKYAIGLGRNHGGLEVSSAKLLPQFMVVTDTHTYPKSYEDALLVASKLPSCLATIHLGDIENQVGMNGDIKSRCERLYAQGPAYPVLGNHDSGEYGRALTEISVKPYLYDVMIRPLIEKGWLNEGEYVRDELYYFRDFDECKTRLIVLDIFDVSETLEEDNEYWAHVDYDETYDDIKAKSYSVGEYVNIPKYSNPNTWSFRCKQATTVSFSTYADKRNQPYIKERKKNIWYQEKQLTWLCNALKTAAAKGNKCIIATHSNVIFPNVVDWNCGFTSRYSPDDVDGYTYRFTNNNIGIISDIVNAFKTKGSVTKRMEPVDHADEPSHRDIDDVSSEPIYTFSFDFSDVVTPVTPEGDETPIPPVIFICGHSHYDFITRHATYQEQAAIGFTQSDLTRATMNDVGLISNVNYDNDIFTTLTFIDENTVHLSRIGRCVSNRILNGKAVSKDNEIVTIDRNN